MCECVEGGLLRLKDEAGLRGAQEAYLPGSSPSNHTFRRGLERKSQSVAERAPGNMQMEFTVQ